MGIYKEIRKMRLEGMSQRQIAATLHISRNTVKKYWNGDSVPWERKAYSRKPCVLTEDVVAFVQRCLDEDSQCGSKKQHHTAKRIYDRLVEECEFTGGETTVRRLVKELREKEQEAFVPLAFPPGDALQIDWGEATVWLGGVKTTVNLFCARLCYSGAPMVLAYRRQNEESFLEALVRVFQYFGGVPKQVIFDNGKVAVKDGFGAHARKQAGYAALSAHYGFEAVFCNPASGNEKGLVEGLVGYIRRNVCVPIPKTETMDALNRMLLEKCESYLSHQIRGKPASVGEMLVQEQGELFPLPGYPFDPCKRTSGRVDRFCTVGSIRITIPFLLLIAEKRCLSRLGRRWCGSIAKGSVLLSTRGAWTDAKLSTSWNTTFRCWKRKAGQSSTPGQCRIPCLETFWIGYKSSVCLPKNWLSSCGGAKRKTVTRL